ncbi:MAG: hypothetical protein WBV73_15705 [Phormidium sp.]
MKTNTSLEERIAAVEAAIAELQKQIANPQPTNWLQQITGSFKDESAFEEVLAYGRAIRQGDESVLEAQEAIAELEAGHFIHRRERTRKTDIIPEGRG